MSWLSDRDIATKIRRNADSKTLHAFFGVYPIDRLPQFIPHLPIIIIVNTHTHNLQGEHWKTVFIDKDKNGELFDSLALPASSKLIRWLNTFTRKWKTNHLSYQDPLSATCGAYALYFALLRLDVSNLKSVTGTLSQYPHVNERRVLAFYKQLK